MPEAKIGIGTSIDNRYRIEKVLGQGGFGRTYLASDEQRFGEVCVLKEFVPSISSKSTVEKSRALFEREAKVLYQINHPQIPKFLASFAQMGRLFIVQEYIDGKTYFNLLCERLQQGKSFSEAEVIQWLRDLLPVLSYLHERNIVHRDISPDNIILPNYQAQPMLIDFGLVKQTWTQIWAADADSSSDLDKSFVGKYGYAPPEQIRRGQCYPCSDLYALGVTALVLLTGKEPSLLIDSESLEWQWHPYVKTSYQLDRILDKMLAEKPKNRYQTAQEVLADLQHVADKSAIAPSTPRIELHIEIDTARKDRQVAEIAEMDYFQQLQKQAEELRNSVEAVMPSEAVNPEIQHQATTAGKLNQAFIDLCRHELALRMGPIAKYIIEETLAQHPGISLGQLVEDLAAEIPNPQQAQEFRNSVENPAAGRETKTHKQYSTSRRTRFDPPVLELIHSSGREFRLLGQEGYIGRRGQTSRSGPEIDLTGIANDVIISRTHARIYWNWSQNAYMLVDNDSRNGTYLNGNRLVPGVEHRLKHGDSLQLSENNLVCFTVSIT